MANESAVLTAVLKHLGNRDDVRVWRNQTGALPDRQGRVVRFGLKGSADVIGLRRVIGTRGDVRQPDGLERVGQFLAVECKSATGRQTREQQAFQRMVESFGGLYILENDPALPEVRKWFP